MKNKEKELSVAYCGLVCYLCNADGTCNCKSENNCGKRLSPAGCFQYDCCREKGLQGCWECSDSPCGKDMLSPEKIKIRAFVRCIKEDGIEKFIEYLERNAEKGIIYHRSGIYGDYDLDTEDQVIKLLRSGDINKRIKR